MIVKALTGDGAEDTPADDGKDKAAQSLGQRGGRGRAKSLTKGCRPFCGRRNSSNGYDQRRK